MDFEKWAWLNGEFVRSNKLVTPVMCRGLQYGAGVFEGIRFYNTDRGPAIFRLIEHLERFQYSCKVFDRYLPCSLYALAEIIAELVRKNKTDEGYVRPIAWAAEESIGVALKDAKFHYAVALCKWRKENFSPRLYISRTMRIHPETTNVAAKICGAYQNSILALLEAQGAGCDDALLLDYKGCVAEAASSNIFMVKEGRLITPMKNTILPGITRMSVLALASYLGYSIEERDISVTELHSADEIFLCGTAVEISPVLEIKKERGHIWISPDNSAGMITARLMDEYAAAVRGKSALRPRNDNWLCFINL